MTRNVLITGGLGFLGKAVARRFRLAGARIVGLGRGDGATARSIGYDHWLTADVALSSLAFLNERFSTIVHCAGNGSVALSLEQPLRAFEDTVVGTAALLEHVRLRDPDARVVVASSAAVYGAANDEPLREDRPPNPVSPYGFHKLMVEQLLRTYARAFAVRAVAVRFFSIYGPGLRRQLLWDAANRLSVGNPTATFWGTGRETRDWIHVDDAASLIEAVSANGQGRDVINGGSGIRMTVADSLAALKDALGSRTEIQFNGSEKPGDPKYYLADTRQARSLGWNPMVDLHDGMRQYSSWVRALT
jgi:UDP-glucose 4-epimerase